DPHAEQPVEDIPMPDIANISDSDDTDSAHLPKIKQRPEWLKPILDDERPATPEPAWVIPSSHILDVENNWANALPPHIKLQQRTLYLKRLGICRRLCTDVIHLQFQMEEFHKMLTNQIDWANPEGDQVRIEGLISLNSNMTLVP
nr:hypothetical protein [Tanacetum cinerariifolium]